MTPACRYLVPATKWIDGLCKNEGCFQPEPTVRCDGVVLEAWGSRSGGFVTKRRRGALAPALQRRSTISGTSFSPTRTRSAAARASSRLA